MTPLALIERRLGESMARDRAKPSRCTEGSGDVTLVHVSGTTVGLALAVELQTGETSDTIMRRLEAEVT